MDKFSEIIIEWLTSQNLDDVLKIIDRLSSLIRFWVNGKDALDRLTKANKTNKKKKQVKKPRKKK
ncbi:MAG: hypothetical protein K2X81_17910 [Candidatus Obscuribacterales bacterium]|nr:hypothetical protein [Candidatus Obscuribacterales bacterium]